MLDTIKSAIMLGMVLFLIGCTQSNMAGGIAKIIQNESVTVTQSGIYQFSYSGDYWRPLSGKEKATVAVLNWGKQAEKLLLSLDEKTTLISMSSEGEYDCGLLTKEGMGYAELNTYIEKLGEAEWCIAEGYETDPGEHLISPLTQCPGRFVVLVMIGPETKKAEDKKELYSILSSFRCLVNPEVN